MSDTEHLSKSCSHVAENGQLRPMSAKTLNVMDMLQSGNNCDRNTQPSAGRRLQRDFFDRDVHEVAPLLIGATLLANEVGGAIVEVEAYHHTDPAAHSYRGRTERNAVMFGPAGYAYVYRSYGIHWCLNFVCESEGSASAVLVRALIPQFGLVQMRRRRGIQDDRLLCSGPGRLCQALGISSAHNGKALDRAPFKLLAPSGPVEVIIGPRIGITRAADLPWRYGLAGSPYLSRPFGRNATRRVVT